MSPSYVRLAVAALLVCSCAVGVTTAGDGGAAESQGTRDSGAASDDGSPYGGDDATTTTGGDAGRGDAATGKDVAAQDVATTQGCAQPTTPAPCDAGCGTRACTANGCYNGYLCDTATLRCKAPGSCP